MKKAVAFLLICIMILSVCAGALADKIVQEDYFPDEKFWGYLKDNGFVTYDSISGSGRILYTISPDKKEMICTWKGIKDLTGIGYFTALTTLVCDRNQLTNLDLSKNTALTELSCTYNQLTSLNVSNTALMELDCSSNQLKSLDVSKNTALEKLSCYYNQLKSLDLSKNTALYQLDCEGNQLTSLDLSKNTDLQWLYCNMNQLTSLDVSKCPEIVRIIKLLNMTDQGTYWDFRDEYTFTRVVFDKNVKVYLGNGEYFKDGEIIKEEEPSAPEESGTSSGITMIISGGKASVTGPADKNASSVTIPDTVEQNGQTYKVTEIKSNAFQNMPNLTTVSIGKNVKTIGKKAFYGCTSLTTVTGGKSVTKIRESAFYGCKALTSFPSMSKLKTIEKSAFKKCSALPKITLGSSVASIGKDAFNGCKALKTITIKSKKLTADNVGSNAFKSTPKKATIKVPKDKVDEYKALLRTKGVNKKAKIKK